MFARAHQNSNYSSREIKATVLICVLCASTCRDACWCILITFAKVSIQVWFSAASASREQIDYPRAAGSRWSGARLLRRIDSSRVFFSARLSEQHEAACLWTFAHRCRNAADDRRGQVCLGSMRKLLQLNSHIAPGLQTELASLNPNEPSRANVKTIWSQFCKYSLMNL